MFSLSNKVMSASYTPERFDAQLALLTDPSHGVVSSTPIEGLYGIDQNLQASESAGRDVVVITGPSGAGKDSIIDEMLSGDDRFVRAKTATTRPRRDTEAPDFMTWMRGKHIGEDDDEYVASLVAEYGLAEASIHHGDVYGLPRKNLDSIPNDRIPVLNTDTEGIASLQASLAGEYSLTSIMICPDTAQSLETRLLRAGRHSMGRLTTALRYIGAAVDTTNYILVNHESDSPAAATAESALRVRRLLGSLSIA
jgi:guanylate kinase